RVQLPREGPMLRVQLQGKRLQLPREDETFMLYTCPLSSVSFCAVLPTPPKVFGFVVKHLQIYAFRRERSLRGEWWDLTVEALSHKIRLKRFILQRENAELCMRLSVSRCE
uniref:Uncharacterized protein n=1 Tax=Hucho hucho TaxID=62062 RepID=A0A4W5JHK6_9TELE